MCRFVNLHLFRLTHLFSIYDLVSLNVKMSCHRDNHILRLDVPIICRPVHIQRISSKIARAIFRSLRVYTLSMALVSFGGPKYTLMKVDSDDPSVAMTWKQPAALVPGSTLPWQPSIPASSSCTTYSSAQLFGTAVSTSL